MVYLAKCLIIFNNMDWEKEPQENPMGRSEDILWWMSQLVLLGGQEDRKSWASWSQVFPGTKTPCSETRCLAPVILSLGDSVCLSVFWLLSHWRICSMFYSSVVNVSSNSIISFHWYPLTPRSGIKGVGCVEHGSFFLNYWLVAPSLVE